MANKKAGKGKKQVQSKAQPQKENIQPTERQSSAELSETIVAPVWGKVLNVSLLLVFILMTIMSFSYGLSGDEVDMNEYGKAILKYFSTFGDDQTVFNMPEAYDRDGVILYYGGFFDFICAIVNQFSPFGEYTTRHILNAWVGFLAILFSVKIVRLISDKRIATLAVWIMFLSPFFLGHSMNNPKDIPLAAGYIAAIYFIIRFFERFPEVKWQDYLLVILSIGITINIRVAGILLIPYLFVYVGVLYVIKNFVNKEDFNLKEYIKPLLIISISGYLAGSLFWPYGLQNPISHPLTALSEMSNFKVNLAQTWEGEKMYSGELPTGYLIKSFFITNTAVLLVGLMLFFVFVRASLKHQKSSIIIFVAFTALFPLFYIIYKKSNVYHAWRHVLFIFPSVVVMTSLGWQYLNNYIAKNWTNMVSGAFVSALFFLLPLIHFVLSDPELAGNLLVGYFVLIVVGMLTWSFVRKGIAKAVNSRVVGLVLTSILLLEPMIFIAKTFPNTVTYHNAFVGGVEGAYGNYEVDYYYNSVQQCTDYFMKYEVPTLDTNNKGLLLSNAVHLVAPNIEDQQAVICDYIRYNELNFKDWDYAIIHIALVYPLSHVQAENWVPDNAIFVARVKGKPLCALIKRKSRGDIKGFEALEKGDVNAGLQHFKDYLETDSSNILILGIVAQLYANMGDVKTGYEYARKAYEINSQDEQTIKIYNAIKSRI